MGHPYPNDPEKAARWDAHRAAVARLYEALIGAGLSHENATALGQAMEDLAWAIADRIEQDGIRLGDGTRI